MEDGIAKHYFSWLNLVLRIQLEQLGTSYLVTYLCYAYSLISLNNYEISVSFSTSPSLHLSQITFTYSNHFNK